MASFREFRLGIASATSTPYLSAPGIETRLTLSTMDSNLSRRYVLILLAYEPTSLIACRSTFYAVRQGDIGQLSSETDLASSQDMVFRGSNHGVTKRDG